MADNVALNAMSGGATVATDDVGGVQYQRVKPAVGPDGQAVDVSATNPMPITQDSGTLLQRAEEIVLLLARLLTGAGGQPPDTSGRARVLVEAFPSTLALPTVTTVATVTKVSQIGSLGTDATLAAAAQSNYAALALRARITVT